MSGNSYISHEQVKQTKLNKKVLYYFVIFVIINEKQ